MLLVKIKISIKDNVVCRLSADLDVQVDIIRCKANGSRGGLSILRIESSLETTAEYIRSWFDRAEGCRLISIDAVSPGKHMATIANARCTLCKAFVGSDCFLESGSGTATEAVIWRVFAPSKISLKSMIEHLRDEGCEVELLSVKKVVSILFLIERHQKTTGTFHDDLVCQG